MSKGRGGCNKKSEWLQWAYPCPVCKSTSFMVQFRWDTPRAGRVTLAFACSACGANDTQTHAKEDIIYPPSREVEIARAGWYRRNTCVVCRRVLVGRQKLYCSDRCRKRYARSIKKKTFNPDKNGHETGQKRT